MACPLKTLRLQKRLFLLSLLKKVEKALKAPKITAKRFQYVHNRGKRQKKRSQIAPYIMAHFTYKTNI